MSTLKLIDYGRSDAVPHEGINPIPTACQMVQSFETIVTRNKRTGGDAMRQAGEKIREDFKEEGYAPR